MLRKAYTPASMFMEAFALLIIGILFLMKVLFSFAVDHYGKAKYNIREET